MSDTVLKQLNDAQTALTAALAGRSIDALEAATAAVAVAVEEVRVVGGWNDRPGLREDLMRVLKGAEAARGRVNAAADVNRRKMDKLISLGGSAMPVSYGRRGYS